MYKTSAGEGLVQILNKTENAVIEHTVNKKTDWDQVTRAVLKSQPRCANDVPDIVSWFSKFGGGTSRTVVEQISDMFAKYVPQERLVSGSFFKTLAN